MKKLLVIGARGHARIILDTINCGKDKVIGLLDDDETLVGSTFKDAEILGVLDDMINFRDRFDECFIAIGEINSRYKIAKYIEKIIPGVKFATIIHPDAIVSKSAKIGQGTIVCAGAIICSDSKIGKHNIINHGAIVEHECILGDFVNIGPGANLASTITIGDKTLVGLGSCVIEDTKIGKNSVIAAGAVVLNDVSDDTLVAGVPAEVKKR